MPLLIDVSETMLWKKKRSRVRAVQIDKFKGLLGIRRMDRIPNARIRELCGVRKGIDERIENAGSCSVGRPRKKWIDTVKECLMKRGLDFRQARRMVQDRSEWQGFVMGNA